MKAKIIQKPYVACPACENLYAIENYMEVGTTYELSCTNDECLNHFTWEVAGGMHLEVLSPRPNLNDIFKMLPPNNAISVLLGGHNAGKTTTMKALLVGAVTDTKKHSIIYISTEYDIMPFMKKLNDKLSSTSRNSLIGFRNITKKALDIILDSCIDKDHPAPLIFIDDVTNVCQTASQFTSLVTRARKEGFGLVMSRYLFNEEDHDKVGEKLAADALFKITKEDDLVSIQNLETSIIADVPYYGEYDD